MSILYAFATCLLLGLVNSQGLSGSCSGRCFQARDNVQQIVTISSQNFRRQRVTPQPMAGLNYQSNINPPSAGDRGGIGVSWSDGGGVQPVGPLPTQSQGGLAGFAANFGNFVGAPVAYAGPYSYPGFALPDPQNRRQVGTTYSPYPATYTSNPYWNNNLMTNGNIVSMAGSSSFSRGSTAFPVATTVSEHPCTQAQYPCTRTEQRFRQPVIVINCA